MRVALVALAVLALASPTLAQDPDPAPDEAANPTRTVTFYPHVFTVGAGAPMPGNTQYPWGEDDFSAGSVTACHDAYPAGAGQGFVLGTLSHCDEKFGLLYVYSTAGFVHSDQDDWSYEDFHNERGQAKDVLLDTTQDITATFYMSADAHPWYPSTIVPQRILSLPTGMFVWNWDPGLHPDWQIEATLYLMHLGEYQGQASDPPPVQEMMDSEGAVVVAQGLSEPQTMLSLDSNLNGGQGEVYEFAVNLGKPQVDRIPKEMDWVMRFRWWSTDGSQRYNIPISWNVNSGEFYPNRFTLPVKNPFDVELVYPQFLHDKLLLHAMLNSPWGSYDVDSRTVDIEVVRDGNQPVTMQRVNRVADFSVAHGGHYKPVNVTWVWDYKGDAAAPGAYKVTVTAYNFQHSAQSTTEAEFRINADGTGTVLKVGRSGQQTSSEAQLAQLQSQGQGGPTFAAATLPAPAEPARSVPGEGLALAMAGLALAALAVRRRMR